ncbi:MAG: hypothetical protein ACKO3V_17125 [Pirellula sp.]
MAANTNQPPEELERLELSDLLAFNSQLTKLVQAGVPVRFPGAPVSVVPWLEELNKQVALNVNSGQSPWVALSGDAKTNNAYVLTLAAWLKSRSSGNSLRVLDPWVRSGVSGNHQIGKSGQYAFWLWLLSLIASVILMQSVWMLYPKLQRFYENSGLQMGVGYRWLQWLYENFSPIASVLATLLLIAPLAWRTWFYKIAKHRVLPSYYSRGFFLAYLIIGGAMTAILGLTVFVPVIEILTQVGEPRP